MTQKLTTEFIDQVNARLVKGAETYGDEAFKSRSVPASLAEIRDELLDVAAYAALTCAKIESLIPAAPAPRVSKELPINFQIGKVKYPELILALTRFPSCVIFEYEGYPTLIDPDNEKSFQFSEVPGNNSSLVFQRAERSEALTKAFAKGEVYHLPAKP